MKSPFFGFDGEVRSRAVDVDEGDEEDGCWNFRPADHVGGKLRKTGRFRTPGLAPTKIGRRSNCLVDRVDCLTDDVFCCGCQRPCCAHSVTGMGRAPTRLLLTRSLVSSSTCLECFEVWI